MPSDKPKTPPRPPIALGKMTRAEDYRRLAEEEAALAELALTNESKAQHYAMAAYYARLADAKEKLVRMTEEATTGDSGDNA